MSRSKPPAMEVSSDEILERLALRCSGKVFVPECKDGPTHYANHLRLDAWSMDKSWAHPCFDGYEIKVSRSDFMADNKMHLYLPLCNRLWVVCPFGMIQPPEIHKDIGLLWASREGCRLISKKKAPYRQIDPPINLLLYVLMCRVNVKSDSISVPEKTREERYEEWKKRIENRDSMRSFGWNLSDRLRKQLEDRAAEVGRESVVAEDKVRAAERRAKNLETAQRVIDELGLSVDGDGWSFESRLRNALSGQSVLNELNSIISKLEKARSTVFRVEDGGQK